MEVGSGCQPIKVRCNEAKGERRVGDKCVYLRAMASVNTKLISHTLHKPSAGWAPVTASAPSEQTIQITPADKFTLAWKLADPQSMPNWLNLTRHSGFASADKTGSDSDKTALPRLVFNPEGLRQMADGQAEKVLLQFKGSTPSSGTPLNVTVSSVEVEMTALSVVSLGASSLKVLVSDLDNEQTKEHLWKPGGAAIEVQQGQSVAVAVTAVDDDDFAVTAGTRSLRMRIGAGQWTDC